MEQTFAGRAQAMADSVAPTRAPPRAAKAVGNPRRKYFRSPPAKRPYISRMQALTGISEMADGAGQLTTAAPARFLRPIRENDCSSHPQAARGRGTPPPHFSKTIPLRVLLRRDTPSHLQVRMAVARTESQVASEGEGGVERRIRKNNHPRCRCFCPAYHKAGRGPPTPFFNKQNEQFAASRR